MRLECPTCQAAYDVPDSLVTAGRVVRCARCGNEWIPVAAVPFEPAPPPPPPVDLSPEPPPAVDNPVVDSPVVDSPVVEPTLAPRPSAMDRLAAHPALPPPSTPLTLAWVASIALLVLVAGAVFTWRSQIVAVWPPSARGYAVLGLQPKTEAPR